MSEPVSTLKELLEDAMSKIETYKHPDISEFTERMDTILAAAGLGTISNDTVTDIGVYGGNLCISTAWSARGCEQTSELRLPMSIVESEDPVHAAKVWSLNQRIADQEKRLAQARSIMTSAQNSLIDLRVQMTALIGARGKE